jgi:ribosomal protein S6--L-glutamate ligase
MNILILATGKNSKAVKRIEYEAKKRNHNVLIVDPMDMSIRISSSSSGYDSIYIHDRKSVRKLNIKDIDVVIPRIGNQVSFAAFILEHLHSNLKIFSTNPAEGIRNASNQLKTLQLLSSNGLPTPRTTYTQNPAHFDQVFDQIGPSQKIVKQTFGSGGSGVSLLKDRKTAIPILQSLNKARASFILQEYLPANGKDYRVIVFGNQVVACMERSAARGDFRANLKQHGSGKAFHLSEEDKALAVRACKAAGLYTAGVDLIMANGRTVVIECNANWGWESEKITGINYSELLIKFCEQNYHKQIPEKLKVVNYEKLLAEERSQFDTLFESIKNTNARYRALVGSPYIREALKKAKGHNVSYTDRNNKRCEITVNTFDDLFKIMTDTFILK